TCARHPSPRALRRPLCRHLTEKNRNTMSIDILSASDRELLQQAAHRFARERIRPMAEDLDRSARFPRELYQEMCTLGLFAVAARPGGEAAVGAYFSLMGLVSPRRAPHGTREQRESYLAPVLQRARLCAFALPEPQAGSDLGGLTTPARPTDGGWVLSGSKL